MGRAKGVPNKVTTETKRLIAKFCDKALAQLLEEFSEIEPVKRAEILCKLLGYIVSKAPTVVQQELTEEEQQAVAGVRMQKLLDGLE